MVIGLRQCDLVTTVGVVIVDKQSINCCYTETVEQLFFVSSPCYTSVSEILAFCSS